MKSMSGFGGGVASLSMKSAGDSGGIVTSNLVLHLDAGDSSSYSGSGTTWTDLSGQGNHTTLVNGPTYSSSHGGYLSFDDSNDHHATLPAIDLTGNEITFAIWTYNQTQTTSSLIFLGDTGASPGNGRILNIHSLPYSGNMYYFDKGYDGTGYDRLSGSFSNTTLHTGWTHWVFTSNASTGSMKMYRNGTLFDSSTGNTKTLTNANGNLRRIARNNGSQCVGAWISNLQLYKKELSASEVTQNFDAMKTRFGLGGIITDNLVLHLDAANSNSFPNTGNTWTDISGQGNNGNIIGATYNSGNGGYFDFDGTNDRVDVGGTGVIPSGTNSFTYSVWIYIDIISGSWGGSRRAASLFSGDTNGTAECGLFRNTNTTGAPEILRFTRHGGSNTGSCEVNVSMNQSQWYNVTLVRDGASSQVVYQDGVQIGTGNLSNSFSSNTMRIGGAANSTGYHGWLDGRLGSVLMYSSALSASEVKHNFDATKGRYV
jgi:hypothetical protein